VGDRLAGPREYTVDPTGRVRAVRAANRVERYAYDAAGNLAGADWPAEPGDGDHGIGAGLREYAGTLVTRAGSVHYQYDRQGRVAVRGYRGPSGQTRAWEYGWDSDDRLVAVSTPDGQLWRYQYDPLGRRIAKQRLDGGGRVVEQVEFAWDGLVPAERATAGQVTTWDWEPGSFRPVSQRDRAGRTGRRAGQQQADEQFSAIVTDILGTPTELVDPTGAVAWRAGGTLWGAGGPPGGAAAGPVDCALRFPGQYHDAETGLNYNYHRYYDPIAARYASADPIGLAGGPDPHGYPRNPTGWADPLGLTPCSLSQLGTDAGWAGMRIAEYDVVHVPEIRRSAASGDGSPRLGPGGTPLIESIDLGLSPKEHTVRTIFHEMFHIRSNAVTGVAGPGGEAGHHGIRM
jgi:RHS repeat-associated protein